jgi:rhamnosyltransferase
LIKNIGFFDADLFIDCVDFDYCLKIREKGYTIKQAPSAILSQRLGSTQEYQLFGIRLVSTFHNYTRRYYMVRNGLIVGKKYFHIDKLFLPKRILRNAYDLLLVIALEDEKIKKTQYMLMGFMHFLCGIRGKLKSQE